MKKFCILNFAIEKKSPFGENFHRKLVLENIIMNGRPFVGIEIWNDIRRISCIIFNSICVFYVVYPISISVSRQIECIENIEFSWNEVYPVPYRQIVSWIAYAEVIMWCVPYRPISGHTISEFREIAFRTKFIYGRRSTTESKMDLIANKDWYIARFHNDSFIDTKTIQFKFNPQINDSMRFQLQFESIRICNQTNQQKHYHFIPNTDWRLSIVNNNFRYQYHFYANVISFWLTENNK